MLMHQITLVLWIPGVGLVNTGSLVCIVGTTRPILFRVFQLLSKYLDMFYLKKQVGLVEY